MTHRKRPPEPDAEHVRGSGRTSRLAKAAKTPKASKRAKASAQSPDSRAIAKASATPESARVTTSLIRKPDALPALMVTLWTDDMLLEVTMQDYRYNAELSGPATTHARTILGHYCGPGTLYQLGVLGNVLKKRGNQYHVVGRELLLNYLKLKEEDLVK